MFCFAAENCSALYGPTQVAYDLDCRYKHPTVCQVSSCSQLLRKSKGKKDFFDVFQDTVSQFWLRGLCSSSSLDTVYKLRQDLSQVINTNSKS